MFWKPRPQKTSTRITLWINRGSRVTFSIPNPHVLGQIGGTVDSAKHNLASTFVNAFVNAGFCSDKLMTPPDSQWIYKNKDNAKLSAIASLGMIHLWDLESGFTALDKYTYKSDDFHNAGAMLGIGMVSSGITSEMDGAFAILSERLAEAPDNNVKISVILGLGFSYAGSAREDLFELLSPYASSSEEHLEVSAFAALALGMVFVGEKADTVSGSILDGLLSRTETDLNNSLSIFFGLAIGLLFLGRGEACEAMLEAIKIIDHPVRTSFELALEVCAFCGTGNVLQVQKFLSVVGEHLESEEKAKHQAIAVIGIATVLMSETIGSEMSSRLFDTMLQYADITVKRAIPLALGLLSVSQPKIGIMEVLSKLSHDNDEFVSQNAVFSLGMIGAGTNNSRIAQMLRQLSVFFGKDPNHLFLVRIAQGLLHMGKGLLTLSPFHSDGLLMSKVAFAGLLALIFSMLDASNSKIQRFLV
jgi:26S proteasome regulatory subunit N1